MPKRRKSKLGDLGPEKNFRLAERLADRAFNSAQDAVRLVRSDRCVESVVKVNEAAAMYGKADGHYANASSDAELERMMDRSWQAVGFAAWKVRKLCMRNKRR